MRDAFDYLSGLGRIGIGEHDDGELVIDVARDVRLETLPGAAMIENAMSVFVQDRPAEAIAAGIWLSIFEFYHGPHLIEARAFE